MKYSHLQQNVLYQVKEARERKTNTACSVSYVSSIKRWSLHRRVITRGWKGLGEEGIKGG
jgi:hypothetical protein